MKKLGSFARQWPATAIAITALAFSFGGGAYAQALLNGRQIALHSIPGNRIVNHGIGPAQLQPTRLTWHSLHLINGWVSSQSVYQTGDPKYAISNGVVYLAGSMHQPSVGSDIFAVLPPGIRPAHNLYILDYTNADRTGAIYIAFNGQMQAYNGEATLFTSLATVSFPVGS